MIFGRVLVRNFLSAKRSEEHVYSRASWGAACRGRHVTPLAESLQALVAVGDAVDYADAVIGNEQGAVRRSGDAHWPAVNEIAFGIGD